jgi:hypothetical protein
VVLRIAIILLLLSGFGEMGLVAGQPNSSAGAFIEMGYGPSSLTPTSEGIPVYAYGDELWMLSRYNATLGVIIMIDTFSGTRQINATLPPGTPVRLHVFNNSDLPGTWPLFVSNGTTPFFQTSVILSGSLSRAPSLSLFHYGLSGKRLLIDFNSTATEYYAGQLCVLGENNGSSVVIPEPASLGPGQLLLERNRNSVNVSLQSSSNANFTFWFELYHAYSYSLSPAAPQVVVAREIRVAASQATFLTVGSRSATVSLRPEMSMRTGRYLIRAFFESPAGLTVTETSILIPNSRSWVSLAACQLQNVTAPDLSFPLTLSSDPGNWPRAAYFMFRSGGVEGLSYAAIRLNISSLVFVAQPWGVRISTFNIGVTPGPGLQELSTSNGTVYSVLNGSLAFVNYSVGLGNETFLRGTAELRPYVSSIVGVNLSRLIVTVENNGRTVVGGSVGLHDQMGLFQNITTNDQGKATFYLPAGSYSVRASELNNSATEVVTLFWGQGVSIVLDVGSGPQNQLLIFTLAVFAGVGVAFNLWIFWERRRARCFRFERLKGR